MIYCSLEPGLLVLEGLQPYETSKARTLVNSLILHSQRIEKERARIPMTQAFIQAVRDAIENIPFDSPPIKKPLKERVIELLARSARPSPIAPAGAAVTTLTPDISSDWVKDEIIRLWLDCLASSLFEKLGNDEIELAISTWPRTDRIFTAALSCPDAYQVLDLPEDTINLAILASEPDWDQYLGSLQRWPIGLGGSLIEAYARQNLGISQNQIGDRLAIKFTRPCYRDISRENDLEIHKMIIDTIACRAYNRLRSDHNDESLGKGKGRRIYVNKMNPDVRLHYVLENNSATFFLYSNRDHDRGL